MQSATEYGLVFVFVTNMIITTFLKIWWYNVDVVADAKAECTWNWVVQTQPRAFSISYQHAWMHLSLLNSDSSSVVTALYDVWTMLLWSEWFPCSHKCFIFLTFELSAYKVSCEQQAYGQLTVLAQYPDYQTTTSHPWDAMLAWCRPISLGS